MLSSVRALALSSVALAATAAAPLAATALPPGTGVDLGDYELNEATAGDPALFETLLDTVTVSVNEKRDGILDFGDAFEVVEDLYDVTATLTARVWRGSTGTITFGYDYAIVDDSDDGDSGSLGFSVTGFAGYDVSYGFLTNSPLVYAPFINRSDDGNTLDVEYYDVLDPGPTIETFLFVTDAPAYRLSGTGIIGVDIFSFGTTDRAVAGLPAPAPVPLPAGLPLLAIGLGALAWMRRSA